MRIVHALSDYTAQYPEPLLIKAGEVVEPAHWDDEWPGWTWCSTASGLTGWVPERYLDRAGAEVVCLYEFDGTELSLKEGERLTVLKEESGWLWCETETGRKGWVPSNRVK